MTSTIFNEDGSVCMWFPPPVPSAGDLEGWTVRHVCSGSHGPACPHSARANGTFAVSRTDVESFNGVLRVVGSLAESYGYRPRSSRIGNGVAFRWTFEREYPDGHRGSDMIIVSKIH